MAASVFFLLSSTRPTLAGPWPGWRGPDGNGISKEKVIRDVLLAQQPNKRFATVEELGALTVFLSTEAGASITGTALPVDGGWTAH